MIQKLSLTYHSDILCVLAYVSQARVDEISAQFADAEAIDGAVEKLKRSLSHTLGQLSDR